MASVAARHLSAAPVTSSLRMDSAEGVPPDPSSASERQSELESEPEPQPEPERESEEEAEFWD